MTFAKHLTLEERREANRIKSALYRANNPERFKVYEQRRRLKRREQNRIKTFLGRRCKLCDIDLTTPLYGAHGTRVHCLSCSKDTRSIRRLAMREWRKKQKVYG